MSIAQGNESVMRINNVLFQQGNLLSKQKGRVQSELTNSIVSKLLFVFCFFLRQKFLFSRKRFLSVSVETSSEKKDRAATSLKFFEPKIFRASNFSSLEPWFRF